MSLAVSFCQTFGATPSGSVYSRNPQPVTVVTAVLGLQQVAVTPPGFLLASCADQLVAPDCRLRSH